MHGMVPRVPQLENQAAGQLALQVDIPTDRVRIPRIGIEERQTPAEEGRDVVLVMLATGAVFLGVILVGQLFRYMGHRRKERRAARRAY